MSEWGRDTAVGPHESVTLIYYPVDLCKSLNRVYVEMSDGHVIDTLQKKRVAGLIRRVATQRASGQAYFAAHGVTLSGSDEAQTPTPCTSLKHAPFPKPLLRQLLARPGYKEPTPVQAAAWPLATRGQDIVAIAQTGSGKTLAYLLPALMRCARKDEVTGRSGTPVCVVMAPTRELVVQVFAEAEAFGATLGCSSVAVYGGAPRHAQAAALRAGAELVVATPGRLMDVMELHPDSKRGDGMAASLAQCSLLVLDEADMMLGLGFEDAIRTIALQTAPQRQTLMFSATWPSRVQRVAAMLMRKGWVRVSISQQAGGSVDDPGIGGSGCSGGDDGDGDGSTPSSQPTACAGVEQRVHVVAGDEAKWSLFAKLIRPFRPGKRLEGKRLLVFANTNRCVWQLGDYCWEVGSRRDLGGSWAGAGRDLGGTWAGAERELGWI